MGERFYVEWSQGCTIIRAEDAAAAERTAARLFGSTNRPYRARIATPADISWVTAMGGCEHEKEDMLCPT